MEEITILSEAGCGNIKIKINVNKDTTKEKNENK
jgi:hypothetical protein